MGTQIKMKETQEVFNLEEVNEVWKAVFMGVQSHETVLILANDMQSAMKKALTYQQNYTIICDWPLTSLKRISTTVI